MLRKPTDRSMSCCGRGERGGKARLRALGLLLLVAASCGQPDGAEREPEQPRSYGPRPNIVLIVIDTARADHFSCYGYGAPTTPNVDALAARGIRFENARSVAPWTLPAHMSMFTGLPPRDHGATWAAFSEPDPATSTATSHDLAARSFTPGAPERMLPARLRAAGYRTYGFSPNPWVSSNHGFGVGFDEFVELWRKKDGRQSSVRLQGRRKGSLEEQLAEDFEGSKSGAAVAGVMRVLAAHPPGEPFFLFVNFLDPHFPYDPPELFLKRFGGAQKTVIALRRKVTNELGMIAGLPLFTPAELTPLYDADLAAADHAVGELVRALESAGVFEDALVLLTSDHGELLGENGRFSHQLYVDEPLMHVPLILKLPRGQRAGTVVDAPLVSNLDVYATVMAAAGVEGELAGSRDLAHESGGARELLVGEYEASRAYLRQLTARNEAFDFEGHLRGRFVVYTPEFRTELAGGEALGTWAWSGPADEARLAQASRAAEQALAAYLAAKDERLRGTAGSAEDAQTRAELEALGYVGSEEPEEPAKAPRAEKRRE